MTKDVFQKILKIELHKLQSEKFALAKLIKEETEAQNQIEEIDKIIIEESEKLIGHQDDIALFLFENFISSARIKQKLNQDKIKQLRFKIENQREIVTAQKIEVNKYEFAIDKENEKARYKENIQEINALDNFNSALKKRS
ncbi:MAG: flagellar FliJ family protein [Proteobacteria bacterium]|nr:flagellar FliJ family protein [Pseudomonadota bacterium]